MNKEERHNLHIQVINFIVEAGRRVTSDEIRQAFGVRETTTGNIATRRLVKNSMEDAAIPMGVPIGADTQGYYVITSHEGLEDYLDNLRGRIAGTQKRIDLVKAAWRVKQGGSYNAVL